MRHASLFSGIGGFELAAQWMGWENVLSCEYIPFCQKVLRHYFPSTHHYEDIKELDATPYRGQIDILTGGFPCQPFSAAGRRRGTEDDRFLWPEMLRVIREIQPTWIVAENVRGIVSQGGGVVFERVCAELEADGYEVQPFCIPACGVSAPHKRERIWFIAHYGRERREEGAEEGVRSERKEPKHANGDDADSHAPHNAILAGLEGHAGNGDGPQGRQEPTGSIAPPDWCESWPEAAARLCRLDDGLPRELDGITVPAWRRESLIAYGNAIVPRVAFEIFKAIAHAEGK